MPTINREAFVKLMHDLRCGSAVLQRMYEFLQDDLFGELTWLEESATKAIEYLLGDAGDLFNFYYYDLDWGTKLTPQEEIFDTKTYHLKNWGDFYDMVCEEYNGSNVERSPSLPF